MYYENLVRLCEMNGVKPGTVARMTGISTATITAWKQGKYTPKQDKLQKIADYFKISLDSFLNGTTQDEDVAEFEDNVQAFVDAYSRLNDKQRTIIDNLLTTFLSKQ